MWLDDACVSNAEHWLAVYHCHLWALRGGFKWQKVREAAGGWKIGRHTAALADSCLNLLASLHSPPPSHLAPVPQLAAKRQGRLLHCCTCSAPVTNASTTPALRVNTPSRASTASALLPSAGAGPQEIAPLRREMPSVSALPPLPAAFAGCTATRSFSTRTRSASCMRPGAPAGSGTTDDIGCWGRCQTAGCTQLALLILLTPNFARPVTSTTYSCLCVQGSDHRRLLALWGRCSQDAAASEHSSSASKHLQRGEHKQQH